MNTELIGAIAAIPVALLLLRTAWLYFSDNNQNRLKPIDVPKTWADQRKITNIPDPLLVNIHTRSSFKK